MPTSRLVLWGAIGSMIAGVAWAVGDLLALVFAPGADEALGSTPFYLIESADAIAEAGMLAALIGLHVVQARSLGRLGRVGFVVAFIGTALVLMSILLVLIARGVCAFWNSHLQGEGVAALGWPSASCVPSNNTSWVPCRRPVDLGWPSLAGTRLRTVDTERHAS